MNLVNIPIIKYFEHCRIAAKNAGYKWIVSLVSYDAERDGLYRNLHRTWLSLDCITGKHILFVVAGKENSTNEGRYNSRIHDTNDYGAIYNDSVYLFNEVPELKDYLRYSIHNESEHTHDRIRKNQTRAVEKLKEYFNLREKDIPCLVFMTLRNGEHHIVPILQDANDVFTFFKEILVKIEPILAMITNLEHEHKELLSKQKSISVAIKEISFSGDEIILLLLDELNQYANETANADLGYCIENRTYGKFEQPIRAKLSKYIDLVKNYERNNGIEFNPLTVSERCHAKIAKKNSLVEELVVISNKIEESELLQEHYLSQIDAVIRESRMSARTNESKIQTIKVMGGYAQINTAYDNASIIATQNNSVDFDKLYHLISDVRKSMESMSVEDVEKVSESLEVIECELKQDKPRKSFLNIALTGLKAIKGSTEFAAAVSVLMQFVQGFL